MQQQHIKQSNPFNLPKL